MSTTSFATLDELWSSVPYTRIEADEALAASGFKLRAWIRRDDADGEAVVLTYAPDMIGGQGIRGLLMVVKGAGSSARDRINHITGAEIGSAILQDGRAIDWGTRQTRADGSRPSMPASAAVWTSHDGYVCMVDASPATAEFVVQVAAELASRPGG